MTNIEKLTDYINKQKNPDLYIEILKNIKPSAKLKGAIKDGEITDGSEEHTFSEWGTIIEEKLKE